MCSGIPEGTYELKIGESFLASGSNNKSRPEFNTLRFDFKPASISSGSEAYIAESQNENDFQVIVPGGGEGQKPTIFKGAKKTVKGDKECLLIFDKTTKELRLERVSANIHVKKTRDTELDKKVKRDMDKLRREKGKLPASNANSIKQERSAEARLSLSSAGDEGGEDVDDEHISALEQLVVNERQIKKEPNVEAEASSHQPPKKGDSISASSPSKKQPSSAAGAAQKQPSPVKKASSFVRKSILAEDLQLSESSSEEEDEDEEMEDV